MFKCEEALLKIQKITDNSSQLLRFLEELYLCLMQGRTLIESLEIIVCVSKTSASVEDILSLFSYFPKLTISELKEKL